MGIAFYAISSMPVVCTSPGEYPSCKHFSGYLTSGVGIGYIHESYKNEPHILSKCTSVHLKKCVAHFCSFVP